MNKKSVKKITNAERIQILERAIIKTEADNLPIIVRITGLLFENYNMNGRTPMRVYPEFKKHRPRGMKSHCHWFDTSDPESQTKRIAVLRAVIEEIKQQNVHNLKRNQSRADKATQLHPLCQGERHKNRQRPPQSEAGDRHFEEIKNSAV
jgi:hypothetical protein